MTLRQQLETLAQQFDINVADNPETGGVELEAQVGSCFDDELHVLVHDPASGDKPSDYLRSAIRDVREYGPNIKKCPDTCPCKQVYEPPTVGVTDIHEWANR